MNLILEKNILPGSWRYLGQRCPNINPSEVSIAGNLPENIAAKLGGDIYKIGRVEFKNAFLVVMNNARFLYVRPSYSGYRKLATRVFSEISWKVDFDHALARRIATSAKPSYQYVLLLRIPPSVNRQHGFYEKKDKLVNPLPDMCFADDRILDKWLGRSPLSRNKKSNIIDGYSHTNITSFGLTLKQRGRFAYSIGMGDFDLSFNGLVKV